MDNVKKSLKEDKVEVNVEETLMDTSNPVLSMVFDNMPVIDINNIQEGIEKIEKLNGKVDVTVDEALNKGEMLFSTIEFDGHRIKLVGFNSPMPEAVINSTVECSYWKEEDKEVLRNHKAHIICYYEGFNEDPAEKYIALYKVAHSFKEFGLIGVINEGAWNCQPAYFIDELISEESLASSREYPLLLIWTSFIKAPADKGFWMFTKGNYIFGVKDFAYKGDLTEAENINGMFQDIFYYIYENNADVDAGHTLQIGEEVYLKFKKVDGENQYLEGPIGTLVIEKMDKSEISE